MIEGKYKSIQGETIIELEDKKYHLVEAGHHHEGNKDHEENCFEEFGHYRVFNSGMLEFTDEREIIEGKEVEADKDWATYQVGLIVDNYIIDEVDKLNIKDGKYIIKDINEKLTLKENKAFKKVSLFTKTEEGTYEINGETIVVKFKNENRKYIFRDDKMYRVYFEKC